LLVAVTVSESIAFLRGQLAWFQEQGYDGAGARAQSAQDLDQLRATLGDATRRYCFALGGGVGSAQDSLMHFKSGFSDRRHFFQTWRVVLEKQRYADLGGGAEIDRLLSCLPRPYFVSVGRDGNLLRGVRWIWPKIDLMAVLVRELARQEKDLRTSVGCVTVGRSR
jgi:hypothetical protein